MLNVKGIEGNYMEYKGKPLVRYENEFYYGDMRDKYILFLMVMTKKKAQGSDMEVPDNVMVQIIPSDGSVEVKKQGMAKGLYAALDLGTAWLERENRS